jgi:hypothetical protein
MKKRLEKRERMQAEDFVREDTTEKWEKRFFFIGE